MTASWHLLTGEYPPACGGVGDYTRLLAHALAERGAPTHVWAPAAASDGAVRVHRVTGFGARGLSDMERRLDATPGRRVLLVQYAPQAFGFRGANLGFCRWVVRRARAGDEVRVMFHEPWVPFGVTPRRNALAGATRWMARLLLAAARRVYVSVPAWEGLLRPWAPAGALQAAWLPIPSTIPPAADPLLTAHVRAMLDGPVLGHFGTYGRGVARLLEPALEQALRAETRAAALLLGRGAASFAGAFRRRHPDVAERVHASDASAPAALSAHLQAVDVALQLYPDGATARRTTLMAPLAHGVAVATHTGQYSEPVWAESGMRIAARADRVGALAARLLADPAERARSAAAGAALYARRFALRHTVDALLGEAP